MTTKRTSTKGKTSKPLELVKRAVDALNHTQLVELERRLEAQNAPSLPVAPEFLDTLAEVANDTLTAALEKINAPKDVKTLAWSMYHLMVYLNNKEDDKETVGNAIIEAVNSIGNLGGIFYANSGNTTPRKGSLLELSGV